MMTVLEIIQRACGTLGISKPISAIGSSDTGVSQLLELVNEEGSELAARSSNGWQALVREATFVTVNQEDQGKVSDLIGPDYRLILNETIWNRDKRLPIYGPRSPSVWQGFKALTFAGPYSEYRIRAGHLLFLPSPAAGNTCALEYVTKNWLTSQDGAIERTRVAADTDVPVLDDELILAGLKWRWRQVKGLEYGQLFDAYETRVIDALARDGTKARHTLEGRLIDTRIPIAIPRQIG